MDETVSALPDSLFRFHSLLIMIITSRFLCFLPEASRSFTEMGELKGHLDARCRALKLKALTDSSFFFACDSENNHKHTASNDAAIVLDILQGSRASGRNFTGISEAGSWSRRHQIAAQEAQYYNLIEFSQAGVRLESDPWGMKPIYVADIEGGTVIAAYISDIVHVFPDLAHPIDQLALAGLINMRTVFSNRTIHQRIRRSHTGSCYRWTPTEGLHVDRSRRILPDTSVRTNTLSLKQIVDDTVDQLQDYLSKRIEGNPHRPVNLGMTGGFDSRLIAASLHSLGIQSHAFTYGDSYHTEVKTARLITGMLNIPHTVLPLRRDYGTRYLDRYLDTTECQASLTEAQLGNLLQIDNGQQGKMLVHGFPGDALWGKHLCLWLDDHAYASHDIMADELAGYFIRKHQDATISDLVIPRDALYKEIRDNIDDSFEPYQSFLLWDLENKQRRPIGACLLLLGSQFDLITPYYQAGLIGTYLVLPRMMLDNRNIVRHVLAQKYPALAKIPHSDETRPSVSNTKHRSPTSAKTQLIRKTKRFLGDKLTHMIKRNPNIWGETFGLSDVEKNYMFDQIKDLSPTIENRLGFSIPSESLRTSRLTNYQIRNLFLVGRYAERLANAGSH